MSRSLTEITEGPVDICIVPNKGERKRSSCKSNLFSFGDDCLADLCNIGDSGVSALAQGFPLLVSIYMGATGSEIGVYQLSDRGFLYFLVSIYLFAIGSEIVLYQL